MDNIYAAPAAELAEVRPVEVTREFFVVAPGKLLLLYFGTFGLYQLVWSYLHWARYRRFHAEPMWPVARAIFSVFFAHSLNRSIEARLERVGTGWQWAPGGLATLYVLATIGAAVFDRLAWNEVGSPYTDLGGLVMMLPIAYAMWRTQQAANIACGDGDGFGNRRLTWANYLWLAVGLVLWAMVALMFHAYAYGVPEALG